MINHHDADRHFERVIARREFIGTLGGLAVTGGATDVR